MDLTITPAAISEAKSAKACTSETKEKAIGAYQKLSIDQVKAIQRMNTWGKSAYITEQFGDKNEKFGISFGLFPLWTQIVEEMVMATPTG